MPPTRHDFLIDRSKLINAVSTMFAGKINFVPGVFLFLLCLQARAQQIDLLPRSNPEQQGVSAAGIINFIDAAGKSKTEFHSFMFLRHGRVIAEGWWNPYKANLKHTLYSTSKSFTAAAIGFSVNEKRINLDDKVISFFPHDVPNPISPNLAELTVKDVLMMSDGQDPDPTGTLIKDSNWVKAFLALPFVNKPGTKFLYNSMGTYMLSSIVQKVTGQKVIDYLKSRLFEPLGITGMDWEISPQDINTGGWGLRLKTEDMAKFGLLYLQKGNWKGRQIMPREWVEEATTMKIMQDPNAPQAKKDSSDWLQGYCYQMWRCRHNAFRADGAFGQFIIMMPDEDAVIAITAETPDMQEEIDLVWNYLLPSMQDGKLPANTNLDATLQQKLSSLGLSPPAETIHVGFLTGKNGKTFTLQQNEKKMQEISFEVKDNICEVTVKGDTAVYKLYFGEGRWKPGETTRPNTSLLSGTNSNFDGPTVFRTAGSYDWKDDHTLELVLRYVESPHTEKMICRFDGEKISIDVLNSFQYGNNKTVLHGVLLRK
jgi:CubicO group peptidase (beta-lactamase class C family)